MPEPKSLHPLFLSPACSLLVSSLSVMLIYLVKTKAQSLALSCVFSGVSVISWNALDVVGTELYPTHIRYLLLKLNSCSAKSIKVAYTCRFRFVNVVVKFSKILSLI